MIYTFVATFQEFKVLYIVKIELNFLEIQCLWDYSRFLRESAGRKTHIQALSVLCVCKPHAGLCRAHGWVFLNVNVLISSSVVHL